ncbi:MAG: flavin reductase [Abditibacteriota bacterium]|nr:flavin reductase [Abditibacteriota bacterium]
MRVLDASVCLKSSLKKDQLTEIDAIADAVAADFFTPAGKAVAEAAHEEKVENEAFFKLSYGLFVLTARDGNKDNGCIINTVMQVTDTPTRIAVCVNKANFTHDMIKKTGIFNVSILTEKVPFKVFEHFGFQSGKNVNKFEKNDAVLRSENGVYYIPKYTNAFMSGKVVSAQDFGTHTLFVADVTEAKALSADPSVTYAYYFANIKPQPKPAGGVKKGFVCKICGYVHEDDTLPPDFVCPLCKHGAEDFEPLPEPAAEETQKGFVCEICGYVYEGDTLPEDFLCPLCKHGAEFFKPLS